MQVPFLQLYRQKFKFAKAKAFLAYICKFHSHRVIKNYIKTSANSAKSTPTIAFLGNEQVSQTHKESMTDRILYLFNPRYLPDLIQCSQTPSCRYLDTELRRPTIAAQKLFLFTFPWNSKVFSSDQRERRISRSSFAISFRMHARVCKFPEAAYV